MQEKPRKKGPAPVDLMEGHYEIDELGNRWEYNPETGFLDYSPADLPKTPPIKTTFYA